jgi:hypothetical protein
VEFKSPLDMKTKKQARAFAMRYFQEGWRREGWKIPYQWPDQTAIVLDSEASGRSSEGPWPKVERMWDEMPIEPEAREFLQSCSWR